MNNFNEADGGHFLWLYSGGCKNLRIHPNASMFPSHQTTELLPPQTCFNNEVPCVGGTQIDISSVLQEAEVTQSSKTNALWHQRTDPQGIDQLR